jgi:hypothetical protein
MHMHALKREKEKINIKCPPDWPPVASFLLLCVFFWLSYTLCALAHCPVLFSFLVMAALIYFPFLLSHQNKSPVRDQSPRFF